MQQSLGGNCQSWSCNLYAAKWTRGYLSVPCLECYIYSLQLVFYNFTNAAFSGARKQQRTRALTNVILLPQHHRQLMRIHIFGLS